jgi:hypothetical protein
MEKIVPFNCFALFCTLAHGFFYLLLSLTLSLFRTKRKQRRLTALTLQGAIEKVQYYYHSLIATNLFHILGAQKISDLQTQIRLIFVMAFTNLRQLRQPPAPPPGQLPPHKTNL